jgi:hypothetical protein
MILVNTSRGGLTDAEADTAGGRHVPKNAPGPYQPVDEIGPG